MMWLPKTRRAATSTRNPKSFPGYRKGLGVVDFRPGTRSNAGVSPHARARRGLHGGRSAGAAPSLARRKWRWRAPLKLEANTVPVTRKELRVTGTSLRCLKILILLGLSLALTSHVCAQPLPATSLPWQPAVDLPITGVAITGWVASELLKPALTSGACRWCDRDGQGMDTLNAVDRQVRTTLRWQDTGLANTLSNVGGFAIVPAVTLGSLAWASQQDGQGGQWLEDALIVAQATAIAADVNQITKFSLARERPFVHVLAPDRKGLTDQPADNNLSFYSGHTSLVFSLAVSSGTVATLRGYRAAPWVWLAGLSLAASTGWLRMAADKHYFSDVMTGAVVGSALGWALPWAFHRPRDGGPSRIPVVTAWADASGGSVQLRWPW